MNDGPPPADSPDIDLAHNTSGGRNVVPPGQGHGGHDIFFAAVQMSRMPMILADPHQQDSPIIFCNRAFEKLTGYEQAEIVGRNCRFLQGADTDRETIDRIREGLHRHEDVQEEVFNYRKNGQGFWNALFISPVFTPDGELLYFFASQLDVTRRREAEAVLQQAQRLETLGSMASGVAHEFNNLMTVVVGSLAQLEQGMPEGSRERTRLDHAKWAAGQAGRLTQQMLSFARRQFHDDKLIDLNDLVRNFDGILQQMAGVGTKVTLELADTPLPIRIDAGQLEMALLNLVRNAADAMSGEGVVTISTRQAEEQQAARICVQDVGTGMSPEVLKRAIEPFFTTKGQGQGTGLGLSMVNGFTEQSGGKMSISSEPGQGTTILLEFPFHSA